MIRLLPMHRELLSFGMSLLGEGVPMSEESRRARVVHGRLLVSVADSYDKDGDSGVSTCACDTARLLACCEALPTELVGFRPRPNLLTVAPSRILP